MSTREMRCEIDLVKNIVIHTSIFLQENVTLLHWAAINNRREIVQYFLQLGADCNAVGGELMSTPLHWATRQGHVGIVVILVQAGADIDHRDGEGCAALHLAAQFGHTSIVGYLIARGQGVNTQDQNGMTALMWAAYRTTTLDPVRLLVTLGSSLTMADSVQGNTALHWAITAKNSTGASIIVNKGHSTGSSVLTQANSSGETPACVLDRLNNSLENFSKKAVNFRVSRTSVGSGGGSRAHGPTPNTGVVHWLPLRLAITLIGTMLKKLPG